MGDEKIMRDVEDSDRLLRAKPATPATATLAGATGISWRPIFIRESLSVGVPIRSATTAVGSSATRKWAIAGWTY